MTLPLVVLAHHEIHDCDDQIDLWHLTKHTIGRSRSLVAYGERGSDGSWTTYTVCPPQAQRHADRFSAWMHLYHHGRDRERPIPPAESAVGPSAELPG